MPRTPDLTCEHCRRYYTPGEEPDPCLGLLPGVRGACCGHGNPKNAYIGFENGVVIREFRVAKDLGVFRPTRRPVERT